MVKELVEYLGTGRRKTAVASVRLRPGTGKTDINGKKLEEYFPLKIQQETALAPLKLCDLLGKYDIIARTRGGGVEGQAVAIRLGISRALLQQDETRKPELKAQGFLKRDPRMKERKKYGLKKARKGSQYSKR